MEKWMVLSQAIQNVGRNLAYECKLTEEHCRIDESVEPMYILYAMLLHTMKAQQEFIRAAFDELAE